MSFDTAEHDVIVVGAGPAGSAAAAALARRGRDVLLVDRAEFPRDKPCGDGIPPGTVGILHDLGLRDELHDGSFTRVRAIRLVSGRGRDFRLDFRPRREDAEFLIVPRLRFDDLLRRHAIACGARFECANVRAPLVEDGRVEGVQVDANGSRGERRARHVIAADGAASSMARTLARRKAPESHRGVALRAYVDGIETIPGAIEFYFLPSLAPGYAWIFPLGDTRANVGVIVRADRFKRRGASLPELLDEFLRAPEIRARLTPGARVRDVATWQVPYAMPRTSHRAIDGVLLVGDAGRFVDSLTGEGIHHAVATGVIAAGVIEGALACPGDAAELVASYEDRCERALGALIRRSYRWQKYVVAHPALVEAVFIGMRSRRAAVVRWLNRVSTDYYIR